MKKNIFVAGHNGMVGSAIVRYLNNFESNIITKERKDLDLLDQNKVNFFFKENKIDQIYIAAAKVGGIFANNEFPAEFIYQNLMIEANLINAAHLNDIEKIIFLGSSCIYPKLAQQPMKESSLLSGFLEPTNEPYAIAKIAGIKLCESYNRQYGRDYRCLMPTNLYGKNDNFHPMNSHVIPGLIRRFHQAKIENKANIVVWGTGLVKREFLHVDDLAEACVFIMNIDKNLFTNKIDNRNSHINVGFGEDISIIDLSKLIARIIGYKGKIVFDKSKPDGPPQKLLDVSLINSFGWKPKINLKKGLIDTYNWYLKNINNI